LGVIWRVYCRVNYTVREESPAAGCYLLHSVGDIELAIKTGRLGFDYARVDKKPRSDLLTSSSSHEEEVRWPRRKRLIPLD
jgi:hypothetical protein